VDKLARLVVVRDGPGCRLNVTLRSEINAVAPLRTTVEDDGLELLVDQSQKLAIRLDLWQGAYKTEVSDGVDSR
jgi:hypothetical protein